jgi:hypothetical protein
VPLRSSHHRLLSPPPLVAGSTAVSIVVSAWGSWGATGCLCLDKRGLCGLLAADYELAQSLRMGTFYAPLLVVLAIVTYCYARILIYLRWASISR